MTLSFVDNARPAQSESDTFSQIRTIINEVGAAQVDLVIEGETGAGKHTVARKIHEVSRRSGEFVAVNCAAIPESLAESELFGVVSGAFTGAQKSRCGYVEASNRGTLYLDEIDSMSLTMQAKLLRVLESRGVERLGSTHFIPVDMRVIVSTKIPLENLVEQKKFQRDLYYRLSVVKIQLPALRARPEVIVPLFNAFVLEACAKHKRAQIEADEVVQHSLLCHNWPGNYRELKASAERFVLGLMPLPESGFGQSLITLPLKERLKRVEKILIESSLTRHGGTIQKVVNELHIQKRTLYNRIKMLNISHGYTNQ